MTTKNFSEMETEIRKGCVKWFKSFGKGRVGVDTQCGFRYRRNTVIHLCDECKVKLSQLISDRNMVEEIMKIYLEDMKKLDGRDLTLKEHLNNLLSSLGINDEEKR